MNACSGNKNKTHRGQYHKSSVIAYWVHIIVYPQVKLRMSETSFKLLCQLDPVEKYYIRLYFFIVAQIALVKLPGEFK